LKYEVPNGRLKPKKEKTFGKVKKPSKGKGRNRKGSKKKNGLGGEVFNHGRVKEGRHSSDELTPEERVYHEWLKSDPFHFSCFCCGELNLHDPIEWHHVKLYSSDPKNHFRLIPLCAAKCHRLGTDLSPHGTPKKWRETFSMEDQNKHADFIYAIYKGE
jgi:hypothetical protein